MELADHVSNRRADESSSSFLRGRVGDDNGSLVAPNAASRPYLARALMLWTAAVLATATAFIVHLAVRFETVQLGYAVGEARKEQQKLIEMKRMLAVEAATLRQANRIETVAHGVLGMNVPHPSQIVTISRSPRAVARREAH